MLFLGICSFLAISCTSDKDGKDFVKCVLKQGILERAAMNIKEERKEQETRWLHCNYGWGGTGNGYRLYSGTQCRGYT